MSVILAVVTQDDSRAALAKALERRYGADYQIVTAAGGPDTDGIVRSLGPVAVALAPIKSVDDFTALLAVTDSHPAARRIAIVDVGDTSVAADLRRALTLSQVDYYIGQPWATPEEELYPVVGEALRVWAHEQQHRYDKVTFVDDPGNERGEQIVDWLGRNGVAARLYRSDSVEGQALLDGPLAGLTRPAALLWDGRALADPANDELAEAMGASTRPLHDHYDIAIVGAGPAGLAAAVYAASEGLHAVVIESYALGGQAGTSAKIRNYLGFPWGLRGSDLVEMTSRQAEQLGAEFIVARGVTALEAVDGGRLLTLTNDDVVRCSTAVLAGGVSYRRLGVPSVDALIGHGVFYGAAAGEAAAMGGLRVAVLGGGNSAGQAAAHLASAGASVNVLIRGDSPAKGMSDYLVQQLMGTRNVTIRCGVQISEAIGDHQLTGLVLHEAATNSSSVLDTDALFVFIGARPHTEWLGPAIATDANGFVLTGLNGARWLETSMPNVFAAGDIRAGSIKRVAAAVGEGSTAAMLARELLDAR